MIIASSKILRSGFTAAALTLFISGCGASAVYSRNADDAIEAHTASYAQPNLTQFVSLPVGVAWNTAVNEARRSANGVAESDSEARRIVTHWRYESPVTRDRTNIQVRSRQHVSLVDAPGTGLRPQGSAEVQVRTIDVCDEAPGPWTAAEPTPAANFLSDSIAQALENRIAAEAARSSLVFRASPAELIDALLRSRAPYTLQKTPDGTAAESDWRVTHFEKRGVIIEVRSRVKATAVPVDHEHSKLIVGATLEHGHRDENGNITFQAASDTRAIENEVLARLIEVRQPEIISPPEETLNAQVDATPHEPALQPPPDPLVGRYGLYVRLASVPQTKGNGYPWDAGGEVAKIIAKLPIAVDVGRALSMDATAAATIIARLTGVRTPGQAFADAVAAQVAAVVATTEAPDLEFHVRFGSAPEIATNVLRDTYSATWDRAFETTLSGDVGIAWGIIDRDAFEDDLVAVGSTSARTIANACGVHCIQSDGSLACFELVHLD